MNGQLSSRARRRLRRIGLGGLALALVLGLAWLALGLLFQGLLDRGRLARWSEARLETALNRDVEVGEVSLSAFPRPTVGLVDLRIGNRPGLDAAPLARVDRLRLRVALWPLLRRRVVVEEVELSDAALHLVVLPDGRSNFGDFAPAGDPEPPSGRPPLRVRVEEIGLERGSVSYRRAETGRELAAREISGRVRLGRDGTGRELRVEVRAGEVRASGLPGGRTLAPVPARLRLDGRLSEGGRASLAELAVSVSGRMDSVARPVRRMDLRLVADSLALADVASLVRRLDGRDPEPDGGTEAAGRLSLDLAVRGPWGSDHRPEVAGLVALREGRIGHGGAGLARALAGEARIHGDSVTLEGLRGRLLDGDLEAAGGLRLDSARSWRLRLRARPRLRTLAALRGEEFVERFDG